MTYLAVGGYILVILLIGWIGWRKTSSLDDHLVAGRQMPLWLASATIAATLVGTGVTLGVSELAYSHGVSAMLYPFLLGVSLAVSVVIVAGKFRKSGALTVPELLAERYGRKVQALVALASALKWLGPTAAQYLAVGYIIHAATGLDPAVSIITGALLIVAYVILGGAWAIAYSDAAQLFVVYMGFGVLYITASGEHGGVFDIARKLSPEYSSWTGVGLFKITAWIGSLAALMFADQAWLQRSAAVKNPRDAILSGLIAAVIVLPLGYLTAHAGMLAALTMPGMDPKTAAPNLIFAKFSPASAALFVTAILAAGMSCVDSWLHSSATLVVKDIYVEFLRPGAEEKEQVWVMNIVTAAMGLGAVALALMWNGAIISLVFLTMVWGAGIYVGPLLLLWYFPGRISPNTALAVILATLIAGTAMSFNPPFGIHPMLTGAIIGYALTFGAYLLRAR